MLLQTIYGEVSTWYFTIDNPSKEWAYQNAGFAHDNIFGFKPNNAVEMWPNTLNVTSVYGLIAQNGYYTVKNSLLSSYYDTEIQNPHLKNTENTILLNKTETKLNGNITAIKTTLQNDNKNLKLIVYYFLDGEPDGDAYLALFWSKPDLFAKYFPEFERVLNTVQFE